MVVQVITMLECPETMSKSCFKKWYRVTSWGDHYYSLGCSDTEPQPETVARRVGVGGITAVIALSNINYQCHHYHFAGFQWRVR